MQTEVKDALTTLFTALVLPLVLSGGCLTTTAGCRSDNVMRAFGYTEPGVDVEWGLFSRRMHVSSDVSGSVVIDVRTNGTLYARGDVTSSVGPAYAGQAARVNDAFLEGRRIEWDGKVRVAESVGPNILAFFSGATGLVQLLGPETAVPIISKVADAFAGSGFELDLEGLGAARGNLGRDDGGGG